MRSSAHCHACSFIFILLALTIFGIFPSQSARADANFGDINADGKVDIRDVITTLHYIAFNITPTQNELRRMDIAPFHTDDGLFGDGKLNILDVVYLLQRTIGLTRENPWPHGWIYICSCTPRCPSAWDASQTAAYLSSILPPGKGITINVDPKNPTCYYLLDPNLNDKTTDVRDIQNDISNAATASGYSLEDLFHVVESDHVAFTSVVPTDTDYSAGKQWYLNDIHAEAGWDITKGNDDVVLAVLDTGVDPNHPELQGKLLEQKDFPLNPNTPQSPVDDPNGHGTHVAGILGALTDNSAGIASLGWNLKLISGRIMNSVGYGLASQSAAGIRWVGDWAAAHPDKRVVLNMSYRDYDPSTVEQDAVAYAESKGVVLVAAAGNEGINRKTYPAGYDGVIAVGATDKTENRAGFSNFGDWVGLAAPGDGIYSLLPTHSTFMGTVYKLGQDYGTLSGTSQASPQVAALAGLMLAKNPQLTEEQVKGLMFDHADVLSGDGNWHNIHRINVASTLQHTPVPGGALPIATPQALELAENTSLPITLAGTGPAGDALTFQLVTPPDHGKLSGTPPSVTYVPNQDYNGTDSFTFTVTDTVTSLVSALATVSLTINADSAPIMLPIDKQTGKVGQPLSITISATDVDGGTLSFTSSNLPLGASLNPIDGTHAAVNWTPGFSQEGDYSIVLTVSDGTLTDQKTADLHVDPPLTPGVWTPILPMPTARVDLGAATDRSGRIYALGGSNETGVLDTVDVYSPATGVWTPGKALPAKRAALAAVSDDQGRIYAIGGTDNNKESGAQGEVLRFDPEFNRWDLLKSMNIPRFYANAVKGKDGRIYVIGGVDSTGAMTSTMEIYNPATDNWSTPIPLPFQPERYLTASAVDDNGLIYVIGGGGSSTLDLVEVYHPDTKIWELPFHMPTARHGLVAARGLDGLIYAISGNNGTLLDVVEAWDPINLNWRNDIPSLPSGKGHDHGAATVGKDGVIYLLGGDNRVFPLNTVEAYYP